MGKSLIIKGADFSVNGIAPEFVQLKSIIATATTQYIVSPLDFPVNGRIVQEFAIPYNELTEGLEVNLFGFQIMGTNAPHKYAMFRCSVYKNQTLDWKVLMYANNGFSYTNTGVAIKDTQKHIIDSSRYNVKIDNGDVISLDTVQTEETPKIGIFGKNGDSNYQGVEIGFKLYSVKIYSNYLDNTSLILDCIPVKKTEDNKICLYDKISGEYIYTNDGTNPNYELLH